MSGTVDDFEQGAVAAFLRGRDEESADAWQRAYAECVRLGEHDRGAR